MTLNLSTVAFSLNISQTTLEIKKANKWCFVTKTKQKNLDPSSLDSTRSGGGSGR